MNFAVAQQIRIVTGCFITAAVLLAASAAAYVVANSARENIAGWVRHGIEVSNAIDEADAAYQIADAVSRRRAGSDSVTDDQLDSARAAAFEALGGVEKMTIDNSAQQQRIQGVRLLLEQRFRSLDDLTVVRRTQGITAFGQMIADGKTLADARAAQSALRALEKAESEIVQTRINQSRAFRAWISFFTVAVFLLLFPVLVAAYWTTSRALGSRLQAAARMREYEQSVTNAGTIDCPDALTPEIFDEIARFLEEKDEFNVSASSL